MDEWFCFALELQCSRTDYKLRLTNGTPVERDRCDRAVSNSCLLVRKRMRVYACCLDVIRATKSTKGRGVRGSPRQCPRQRLRLSAAVRGSVRGSEHSFSITKLHTQVNEPPLESSFQALSNGAIQSPLPTRDREQNPRGTPIGLLHSPQPEWP